MKSETKSLLSQQSKVDDAFLANLQMATAEFDTCTHEQLVIIARLARVGLDYINEELKKPQWHGPNCPCTMCT